MRIGEPYLAPTVEIVDKTDLEVFAGSRRVVILLLGSTSPRAFLLPVVHHFAKRLGQKVRFGYIMTEGLHDRASLLPQLGQVFTRERRRPRAARRGYYLFFEGQVIGFHRGLNDPVFAPLVASMMEAIPSQKPNSETLRLFQRVVQEIALSVIGQFSPLLFGGPGPALGADAPPVKRTNPYEILGLQESASDAEVKRAYRSKLRESHPDLVATLSEEIRQRAQERSQRIIRAYRQISQSRHPQPPQG